ncbi:MAG TPA: hypothetical protein VEW68_05235 [Patescibacteria group bacterium]|nr:hypothetical protein [Patescibacteria group bacterium]
MSARLSPDGMYYWDGERWLTTISPDGRFRWDGSAWRAVSSEAPTVFRPARTPSRIPTSWTRPLQLGVAGWYALSSIYSILVPLWMQGPLTQAMSQSMHQSLQQQIQQDPSATPLPPGFEASMTNTMDAVVTIGLWAGAAIAIAIAAVVIIGAARRWTWLYIVVLVLLGLGVIALPANIINLATGGSISAAPGYGFKLPSWVLWTGTAFSLPGLVLFVFMLIALLKRGPWGMVRANP